MLVRLYSNTKSKTLSLHMVVWGVFLLVSTNPLFGQVIPSNTPNEIPKTVQKKNQNKSPSKDTLHINNLIEIASKQRFFKLDSLYDLSTQTLSLSKNANYKKGEIKSYLNIGDYFSSKGESKPALKYYQNAFDLSEKINDKILMAKAMNKVSTEYGYLGNNAQALRGYLMVIEIAEKINDKTLLSIVNENIAELYLSQKDYEQAMVFFKKVKVLNEQIGNPIFMAETMSNMASAYADMNELEYAMFNINSSITTFEKEKIYEWLAYAYQVKGKIYLKQNKYKWALYWYKQSELLHIKVEDDREEITLLNGMAEAYFKQNNDSLAERYAINAYNLSKKINFKIGKQESSKLLFQLNKIKENFEDALVYHEIYQETFDSLAKNGSLKALNMLKTKMEYDQQKKQLIIDNEKALAKQKIYIYVSVIVLVVFFVLLLLIRRNERIQKKLNTELISKKEDLEKKEEYLQELNNTKNKLFSIIGHDLRGPIGAFKELLTLFKQDEMTNDEFLSYVPKLKLDIDNISFTLNNLLSWGQTQMNGATTKAEKTSLNSLVDENIALLSEVAFAKNISVLNKTEENDHVWADRNQLDIVIRNLLSNALKFTSKGGEIVIASKERTKFLEIEVRDNGLGMSEETMVKIFKKDANHTTYGTNDEKGTGLGLSLCKEMVEKNSGTMWVNSTLGNGSSFYFTVPKLAKRYQKSA